METSTQEKEVVESGTSEVAAPADGAKKVVVTKLNAKQLKAHMADPARREWLERLNAMFQMAYEQQAKSTPVDDLETLDREWEALVAKVAPVRPVTNGRNGVAVGARPHHAVQPKEQGRGVAKLWDPEVTEEGASKYGVFLVGRNYAQLGGWVVRDTRDNSQTVFKTKEDKSAKAHAIEMAAEKWAEVQAAAKRSPKAKVALAEALAAMDGRIVRDDHGTKPEWTVK